jgi:hypothetical protein
MHAATKHKGHHIITNHSVFLGKKNWITIQDDSRE